MCQTTEVIWHYGKVKKRGSEEAQMKGWVRKVKLMVLNQMEDVNVKRNDMRLEVKR